ncbi:hypothetical protein JW968_00035 [Candidatus Woesearchaeota archaeon]|nr:hypothetical protein [Candidatus Woesearchaeota archaeon]
MVLMDEKVYLDELKLISEELLISGLAKDRAEADETAKQWLNSVKNDIVF